MDLSFSAVFFVSPRRFFLPLLLRRRLPLSVPLPPPQPIDCSLPLYSLAAPRWMRFLSFVLFFSLFFIFTHNEARALFSSPLLVAFIWRAAIARGSPVKMPRRVHLAPIVRLDDGNLTDRGCAARDKSRAKQIDRERLERAGEIAGNQPPPRKFSC